MDAFKNKTLASRFGGLSCRTGVPEAGRRMATGGRAPHSIRTGTSALGVVVAGRGYPGSSEKGKLVELQIPGRNDGALVFHASTGRDSAGRIVTGGGRSFTVVGRGKDLAAASAAAYDAAPGVRFDGAWYRGDIGRKFIGGRP
jgi:phosphoribosylamine-glycine ligase